MRTWACLCRSSVCFDHLSCVWAENAPRRARNPAIVRFNVIIRWNTKFSPNLELEFVLVGVFCGIAEDGVHNAVGQGVDGELGDVEQVGPGEEAPPLPVKLAEPAVQAAQLRQGEPRLVSQACKLGTHRSNILLNHLLILYSRNILYPDLFLGIVTCNQ